MIYNIIHNANYRNAKEFIDDKSVDLVITDPPYKIEAGGGQRGDKGVMSGIFYRNKGGRDLFNYEPAEAYMREIKRIIKPSAHIYVFTNDKNLNDIITAGNNIGLKLMNIIVLDKGNKVTYGWYMKQTEYVLLFRNTEGKAKQINNMSASNLIKVNFPRGKNRVHPSEKSVDIYKEFILQSSEENDIVCDLFAGSGTVALAAMATNRRYVGIELDEAFYNNSMDRISEFKTL